MSKHIDLTGKTFGKLNVIKSCGRDEKNRYLYLCLCKCGNTKIIVGNYLLNGDTKSCGCLQSEQLINRNKKYNIYDLSDDFGIGYTSNTNEPFYFDLEDYEKIKDYCWSASTNNYIITQTEESIVLLHRFIMNVIDKNITVDHINNDVKNNRKYNLRICSMQNNSFNRGLFSNNTSGTTGVYFNKKCNKWVAQIKINYKHKYLGSFNNIKDAIEARKQAEEKYFGEYSFNNSQNKYLQNQ